MRQLRFSPGELAMFIGPTYSGPTGIPYGTIVNILQRGPFAPFSYTDWSTYRIIIPACGSDYLVGLTNGNLALVMDPDLKKIDGTDTPEAVETVEEVGA